MYLNSVGVLRTAFFTHKSLFNICNKMPVMLTKKKFLTSAFLYVDHLHLTTWLGFVVYFGIFSSHAKFAAFPVPSLTLAALAEADTPSAFFEARGSYHRRVLDFANFIRRCCYTYLEPRLCFVSVCSSSNNQSKIIWAFELSIEVNYFDVRLLLPSLLSIYII